LLIWDGCDEKHCSPKYPGKVCIKTTIIKQSLVLMSFPGGQADVVTQVVPFAITLPTDLPPSLFYMGKGGSQFRV